MKNIFLTLVLLSTSFYLKAQFDNPDNWRYYKAMEKVNCHLETSTEFLLGTKAGLVTLNKSTFENSIQNLNNSNLPSNSIEAIQIDSDGNTWIGTYDYILARQEGDDWIELPIPVDQNALSSSVTPKLFDFEIAADGSFWLATNNGLWHYRDQNWEVYNHWAGNIPSNQDFGEFWNVEEANGTIYFSGLELYKIEAGAVTNLTTDFPMCTFYQSGNLIAKNGKFYVSDFFTFIAVFDNDDVIVEELSAGNFPSTSGFRFDVDSDEIIHVVFSDGEKYLLDGNSWIEQTSPIADQILSVDLNNYYFLSQTDQDWLNQYNQLYWVINNNIQTTSLSDNPLLTNNSKNFAAASDNGMYLLDDEYGIKRLSHFHPTNGWTSILLPNQIDGVDINIRNMAVTESNWLIFPTFSNLVQYDGTNWSLVADFPLNGAHLISTPTSDGPYHVANLTDIASFDGSNWTVIQPPFTTGGSTWPNNIKTIATAPNGDLWLVRNYDFLRYTSDGSWTVFDEDDTSVITSSAVSTIDFEENGTVWISAGSHGILRYADDNWSLFEEDDGVYGCRDLTITPSGDIWAATFEGLAKFNGTSWDLWTEDNCGLIGEDVMQVNHTSDGTLWVNMDMEGIQLYDNNAFPSGISGEEMGSLDLYPNPTRNFICLENIAAEQMDYQILNNIGQLVQTGIIQNQRLNIEHLVTGIYFIKIETKTASFIGKAVKR